MNITQRGSQPNPSHKQGSSSCPQPNAIQGKSTLSHEMTRAVGTAISNEEPNFKSNRGEFDREKVSKPVSESQRIDPRLFQLNQLRRRFSPAVEEERDATVLKFKLVPTDPDFPFEMTDLQCTLLVPQSYPIKGRPSLRVSNPEMDRGYQINVERGFDSLVMSMPQVTLLALINELDKRMESFLMNEKAQTIKLVTNIGKKTSATVSRSTALPATPDIVTTAVRSAMVPAPPEYTTQQTAEAKVKRESDIRQLEARMGRQPLFSKSSDGLCFFVPLHISNLTKLPLPLRTIKVVKLLVPLSYNLEPCSVLLVDARSDEADAVQLSFERYAREHPDLTLMAHVNHLAQNMRTMSEESAHQPEIATKALSKVLELSLQSSKDTVLGSLERTPEDRPHLHRIPRPPEWDTPGDDNAPSEPSLSDGSEDESSEYDDDEEDGGGAVIPSETQTIVDTGPDLGILLSFPFLELYGAELLQLYSISLTIKCDRCKDMMDVKNVRPHAAGETSLAKHENCKKCANHLNIGKWLPQNISAITNGY